MDNNALVDESFALNAEPIQDIEETQVEQGLEQDRELASLHGSRGWERIAKDMRDDVNKLRNLTGAELAGLSKEEVGEKFLTASLVADHLQKYLDKVEYAAKAVADAERAKQPK